VATSTLTNPSYPHQLFAGIVRAFSPSTYAKLQPEFRVFPTGQAEYHWLSAALATNQTISRHKSLTFALRKCTRLNKQFGRRSQK